LFATPCLKGRPYPLQSGTLTDFKTTADRSAERSDRPPELYATSNGLPEHNTRESAARPIGHIPAGYMWPLVCVEPFQVRRDRQMTRKPLIHRRHMLVTAPTAGRVNMLLLSHSHATVPAVALLSVSSCCTRLLGSRNMTGLKIAFELEPQQPTPLMRIG
jgi:hypothetical protein